MLTIRGTMHTPHDRKGMALGIVLIAIAVISIMIVGAYFANIQEYRLGANGLTQARAMSAAEYGHGATYQRWDRAWKLALIEERNPQWRDLSDELAM